MIRKFYDGWDGGSYGSNRQEAALFDKIEKIVNDHSGMAYVKGLDECIVMTPDDSTTMIFALVKLFLSSQTSNAEEQQNQELKLLLYRLLKAYPGIEKTDQQRKWFNRAEEYLASHSKVTDSLRSDTEEVGEVKEGKYVVKLEHENDQPEDPYTFDITDYRNGKWQHIGEGWTVKDYVSVTTAFKKEPQPTEDK